MLRSTFLRTIIPLAAFATLLLTVAACGSSDSAPAAAQPAQASDAGGKADEVRDAGGKGGLTENRLITRTADHFTMDDLVAVGFKKSKQFATDTLPKATDVWYGFFDKKDIEVRVYESHEDAMNFGVEPAEVAIAKEPGQTDYLIPVVNRYPAYVVAGNMVMLCERQLATCEALIQELK